MPSLVQFLAAGVKGAESGTATFLLRGTASSAASVLYEDFEGTAQPGTNVLSLDANGGVEIYSDAYVDVVIRNSGGTTLRTVTLGHSAPLVEVKSTSFTGTDYDGDPSNAVNNPVTLKALLDKWIVSAGAADWQVSLDGSEVNISDALASVVGLGINVKADPYNAAGDGVTDDSTAIAAATTAADGLPVLFPPGTYLCANLSIATAQVNWVGAGAGSTIIRGSGGSGNFLALTDNTANSWKKFQGIRFSAATGYDRLIRLESTQNDSFFDCDFDFTNCSVAGMDVSGAGRARVFLRSCRITVPASVADQLSTATDDHEFYVDSCSFTLASGFSGHVIEGAGFVVSNCVFDGSALAGVCRFIQAENSSSAGVYRGTFTGNTFIDNDSGSFVFDLTDIDDGTCFVEQGNNFIGFTEPAGSGDAGHIYDLSYEAGALTYRVVLGSRIGRTVHITRSPTDTSNPFFADAALIADTVIVHHESDSPAVVYSISPEALPPGCRAELIVANESGFGDLNPYFEGAPNPLGGAEIIPDVGDLEFGNATFQGTIVTAGNPFTYVVVAPEFARSYQAA